MIGRVKNYFFNFIRQGCIKQIKSDSKNSSFNFLLFIYFFKIRKPVNEYILQFHHLGSVRIFWKINTLFSKDALNW